MATINDKPPSYHAATGHAGPEMRGALNEDSAPSYYVAPVLVKDIQVPAHPSSSDSPGPGPLSPPVGMGAQPVLPQAAPTTTSVYYYVNPVTYEHTASFLPPDDPEMVCLQEGRHIPKTHFGILGILVAVFYFPFGIGICLLDRRVRCARCGAHITESVFG